MYFRRQNSQILKTKVDPRDEMVNDRIMADRYCLMSQNIIIYRPTCICVLILSRCSPVLGVAILPVCSETKFSPKTKKNKRKI